jgi:hypothetical protein
MDLDEVEMQGAGPLNPRGRAAQGLGGFHQRFLVSRQEVRRGTTAGGEEVLVDGDATRPGPRSGIPDLPRAEEPPPERRSGCAVALTHRPTRAAFRA